jgi:addiction module HigA family antidote
MMLKIYKICEHLQRIVSKNYRATEQVNIVSVSMTNGEYVSLEDFMKPIGLSQYRLAKDIGVTPIRISQIVNGKRSVTVDTAMRLARYFDTSAGVWLRLQVRYDLEIGEDELSERINREVKVYEKPFASA